ncbi:MAG TPA: ornithine carbamoyltransferase, partial [Clostridia bacterium]|nr:ornithine carbamoyltransferase [Clostridia bacterium]
MKHLLKLSDLSKNEILDILNFADQLKYENKNGIKHHLLKGKTLGMIFTKASTRTRVSFEVGMYQLGGNALFLSGNDLQLNRGEPICDTARVLSRYLDGIMIRTFKQSDVEELAKFGSIPIINGLTDYCHPCQVLADLMTIREFKGTFKNLKLCFIGDGNNMANSLIVGCIKLGIKVSIACPNGYEPDEKIVKWGVEQGLLEITSDLAKAAASADVIYTDVWASMGQEKEAEDRKKAFYNFQVNDKVMSVAKKDAIVLH